MTTPTVLVLGAGASCTYGFPLGLQLKARICKALRGNGTLIAAILSKGKTLDDIQCFHQDLILSGDASIDAFLQNRNEYVEMGKLAIAAVLLPLEKRTALFDDWIDKWDDPRNTERHWYQLLFTKVKTGASRDNFGKDLRIVTFNYDRSLEYYLVTCIRTTYGFTEEAEAYDLLQSIPIVHVYGKLADLGELKYDAWGSATEPERFHLLDVAAEKISIVHEGSQNGAGFKQAREYMTAADRICVLGFGFDMTSVDRLFPRAWLTGEAGSRKWIGGTTYGISDQFVPVLDRHGFAGFKNDGQRKAYWPPMMIYDWLSTHKSGSLCD